MKPAPTGTYRILSLCTFVAIAGCGLSAALSAQTLPHPQVDFPQSNSQPLVPIATPSPAARATLSINAGAATIAAAAVATGKPLAMKLLVLAGNTGEPSYGAITAFLNQIGVPFTAQILSAMPPDANGNRLSSFPLSDSSTGRGLYQGIILTNGNFGVCDPTCHSLLSAADWSALDTYAAQWGVRVVSYYTFPEARYGLAYASGANHTDANPLNVTFTTAAATIFPYLNRANAVPVTAPSANGVGGVWAYLATPVAATGETTTPILTSGTFTVGATHTSADGRESLALTMDNDTFLLHSLAFNYGLVNWVTRGVFLGARRMYLTPQIDDMLIADTLYTTTVAGCAPNAFQLDPTSNADANCPTFRGTGTDLQQVSWWQSAKEADALFGNNFGVTFAYNGIGTTTAGGRPANDTLVPAIQSFGWVFHWISHTWDHENLDCYDPVPNSGICTPATSAQSLAEITQNATVATTLKITPLPGSMVTPNVSGLANPAFLTAAQSRGIKYLVSDATIPSGAPPTPNTGIIDAVNPSILLIPRRATNVFFNTSSSFTGVVGSLPDEYNHFYGPAGLFPFFTANQTYSQIIDRESSIMLVNMLHYEPYPTMFHVANIARYDGTHSLFSDVMDAVIAKYKKLVALPVTSLDMQLAGPLLTDRMNYNASGVTGVFTPGLSVVLTVSATGKAANIPVTGACSRVTCGTYGGQLQDNVAMTPGKTVTLHF
jgi:hypothetical protein